MVHSKSRLTSQTQTEHSESDSPMSTEDIAATVNSENETHDLKSPRPEFQQLRERGPLRSEHGRTSSDSIIVRPHPQKPAPSLDPRPERIAPPNPEYIRQQGPVLSQSPTAKIQAYKKRPPQVASLVAWAMHYNRSLITVCENYDLFTAREFLKKRVQMLTRERLTGLHYWWQPKIVMLR